MSSLFMTIFALHVCVKWQFFMMESEKRGIFIFAVLQCPNTSNNLHFSMRVSLEPLTPRPLEPSRFSATFSESSADPSSWPFSVQNFPGGAKDAGRA